MMYTLDHLLWEELRLGTGEQRFRDVTGVAPAFGGVHPNSETHNSLLSLGETYLELIALTPKHLSAAKLPEGTKQSFRPGLLAFGVHADDLAHVERLAQAAELSVIGPREVTRRTPDRTVLRWQTLEVGGHDFGAAMPFFTHFDQRGSAPLRNCAPGVYAARVHRSKGFIRR